jgi:hypothetical protein
MFAFSGFSEGKLPAAMWFCAKTTGRLIIAPTGCMVDLQQFTEQ